MNKVQEHRLETRVARLEGKVTVLQALNIAAIILPLVILLMDKVM